MQQFTWFLSRVYPYLILILIMFRHYAKFTHSILTHLMLAKHFNSPQYQSVNPRQRLLNLLSVAATYVSIVVEMLSDTYMWEHQSLDQHSVQNSSQSMAAQHHPFALDHRRTSTASTCQEYSISIRCVSRSWVRLEVWRAGLQSGRRDRLCMQEPA